MFTCVTAKYIYAKLNSFELFVFKFIPRENSTLKTHSAEQKQTKLSVISLTTEKMSKVQSHQAQFILAA